MSINTPYNVTLTEGQIGIILCSLEDSVKKSEHLRKDRVKGLPLQPLMSIAIQLILSLKY